MTVSMEYHKAHINTRKARTAKSNTAYRKSKENKRCSIVDRRQSVQRGICYEFSGGPDGVSPFDRGTARVKPAAANPRETKLPRLPLPRPPNGPPLKPIGASALRVSLSVACFTSGMPSFSFCYDHGLIAELLIILCTDLYVLLQPRLHGFFIPKLHIRHLQAFAREVVGIVDAYDLGKM